MNPRSLNRGLAVFVMAAASAGFAAPYTPAHDDEIVQRLPARLTAPERAQRARLAQDPTALPLALQTARTAIERARRTGDPRELGAAQAALSPWWALENPPAAVRLLRATVKQSQHQFDAALADLAPLVAPSTGVPPEIAAQAMLTRATVLQVTGHLSQAMQACQDLHGAPLTRRSAILAAAARACLAELLSLQGQADRSARELADVAAGVPGAGWIALMRAELAERQGRHSDAQARYQEALRDQPDVYTIAAYADWLLERNRPRDALEFLMARQPASDDADALLLRRAIARHRLGDPRARADADALRARFSAARQRGEEFHSREEARLSLGRRGRHPAGLGPGRGQLAPTEGACGCRVAGACGPGHRRCHRRSTRA